MAKFNLKVLAKLFFCEARLLENLFDQTPTHVARMRDWLRRAGIEIAAESSESAGAK